MFWESDLAVYAFKYSQLFDCSSSETQNYDITQC